MARGLTQHCRLRDKIYVHVFEAHGVLCAGEIPIQLTMGEGFDASDEGLDASDEGPDASDEGSDASDEESDASGTSPEIDPNQNHLLAVTETCTELRAESLAALFKKSIILVNYASSTQYKACTAQSRVDDLHASIDATKEFLNQNPVMAKARGFALQLISPYPPSAKVSAKYGTWWTIAHGRASELGALLPSLVKPISVKCPDLYWTFVHDYSQHRWFGNSQWFDRRPDEEQYDFPAFFVPIEDKKQAHETVDNNRPKMLEEWGRALKIQHSDAMGSPSTTDRERFARLNEVLDDMRDGYHALIEGKSPPGVYMSV